MTEFIVGFSIITIILALPCADPDNYLSVVNYPPLRC